MAHPRKSIRQAVAAQLTGKTAAATRVFKARVVPFKQSELPAVAVYTPDEEVETTRSTAPRELERVLQLVVEGVTESGSPADVDDTADDLALEIEAAIDADPTLGGTASDVVLARTESDVFSESGKNHGVVRLTFTVYYETYAPMTAPTADDFLTADIRHNLGGAQHPADQANDLVTVQE
jgi:phage tail sheath gpL-like